MGTIETINFVSQQMYGVLHQCRNKLIEPGMAAGSILSFAIKFCRNLGVPWDKIHAAVKEHQDLEGTNIIKSIQILKV